MAPAQESRVWLGAQQDIVQDPSLSQKPVLTESVHPAATMGATQEDSQRPSV
jgi:hypothetical protein